MGFIITKKKNFQKRDYVDLTNVISLSDTIMTEGVHVHRGLKFSLDKKL